MKSLRALAVLVFAVFLLYPASARADVNDFVVNSFHADYQIDNDKVGGSLLTTEDLDITFSDNNHGILRSIPKSHSGYDTKLKVVSVLRDGANENLTTYEQNGNLVLKIGDANKTITGNHKYKIVYYQERIINFSDGQEFYWDVNGDEWLQSFTKVTATVSLKNGEFSSRPPICYTGYRGSTDKNCVSKMIDKNKIELSTTSALLAKQTLTIGLEITSAKFVQPTTKDRIADNYLNIAGLASGLMGCLLVFNFWRKNGKDYSGKGTIMPEYEPPKDLTPAEIGLLADYTVGGQDLSATLIDLAVRGYVKIHQETKKVLFFSSQNFSLELVNSEFSGLKEHEKALIDGVFSSKTVGEKVAFKDINKTKMSTATTLSRKQIQDSLMKTYGLIDQKSNKQKTWMIVGGFMLLIGVGFLAFLPPGFRAGLGLVAGLTILLSFFMDRRTHAGVEIYEKIQGLKLYMNTAEKHRLKMMQSVDRPYAPPEKTADLFEKLLPFAVALGVEKSWAKQFDGILTQSPTWLSTSGNAFTANSLASSLAGVSSSFSSSFQTSSGASGGSSGGGGGGGGGGGW